MKTLRNKIGTQIEKSTIFGTGILKIRHGFFRSESFFLKMQKKNIKFQMIQAGLCEIQAG